MTETIRPISTIARDIAREWKAVNYAAVPYLRELRYFDTVTDTDRLTGFAAAPSIIRGFLGSSSSFRGDTAAALKNELRAHIGEKPVTPRKASGEKRPNHYEALLLWESGSISTRRFTSKGKALDWVRTVSRRGMEGVSVDAWRIHAYAKITGERTIVAEKLLVARGMDGSRGAHDGD